jgi:indolepyruvate ferredoxin oxidoreductase
VQPVATEFGRKTAIHQSSCNLDYSCLAGDCPSFLTVTPGRRAARTKLGELSADAIAAPSWRTDPADFTVRITGVGGTGVVTVAQVLATAAVIAGKQVRTLDQTGLAQKGGAVVSDVKVSDAAIERAAKVANGECDLYLACDALVGADPTHLAAADPQRTTAVVSTTEVPTGAMIIDTAVTYPTPERVRAALADEVARSVSLDARGLAEDLFDDDQFANILQLGAAFQTGAIPLPAEAVERAIELNGAAVAANLQAFRRGRQLVADPDALHAELAPAPVPAPVPTPEASAVRALVAAPEGSELARLLDIRVPDLVGYQHAGYARQYAEFVEEVRGAAEPAVTEAVARNLYKLMAYKDEYEVARLALDPAVRRDLEERFGAGARYAHRLHPPVLRALGMRRKISLGSWFRPAFAVLRGLRKLRGTALDPFARTEVRRTERALIGEYTAAVRQALAVPQADPALVAELAELPDLVRGYEEIKLNNVVAYRRRLAELLGELESPARAATSA